MQVAEGKVVEVSPISWLGDGRPRNPKEKWVITWRSSRVRLIEQKNERLRASRRAPAIQGGDGG